AHGRGARKTTPKPIQGQVMTTQARVAGGVLAVVLLAVITAALWWQYHARVTTPNGHNGDNAPLTPTPGVPWFVDVTKAAGIDFTHFDSNTDIEYIMETMGSGLAWIDYDRDGWPDL